MIKIEHWRVQSRSRGQLTHIVTSVRGTEWVDRRSVACTCERFRSGLTVCAHMREVDTDTTNLEQAELEER